MMRETIPTHNQYAIAALKQQPKFLGEQVVGQLPWETHYIIVQGGVVTMKVIDMKYLFIIHY